MKDIRSLYLAAKNGGASGDIDQYRAAITEAMKQPLDYLSGLEYIISSSIGLSTLESFIDQYGLAAPIYEQVKETVCTVRDRAKSKEKDTTQYDEAVAMLEAYGQKYARLLDMYEFFQDPDRFDPKQYVEAYYGFNTKGIGIQGRRLPVGMIDRFGEAAVADAMITAEQEGGPMVETMIQYLNTSPHTMMCYEWVDQSMRTLIPEQYQEYYLGDLHQKTMSFIVENMHQRVQEQINESVMLGTDEEAMLEYSIDEIRAIKDLISFREYTVLCESFPTTLDDVFSLYEELDGFLDPEDPGIITNHLFEDSDTGVVDRAYKSGYDYETGHAVKVVYDISPEASPDMQITAIGPAAPYAKYMEIKADFVRDLLTGKLKGIGIKELGKRFLEINPSKVYEQETQAMTLDRLRKEGYMDFQAEGCRILEIIDRVTGESLTRPVAIFGIFALPPNMPLALPQKALDAWHDGSLTGVGAKEGGFTLNKVSAGEIDAKTFMATHWFNGNDKGYAPCTASRQKMFGYIPYDVEKDPTIPDGNERLRTVRGKFNGFCADPETLTLVPFDLTCRNLANVAYLGKDMGRRMDNLDQRRMDRDYYVKKKIKHADGKVRLHRQVLNDANQYMSNQLKAAAREVKSNIATGARSMIPGGKRDLIAKAMAKMDLKTGGIVKEIVSQPDEESQMDVIQSRCSGNPELGSTLEQMMAMYRNKDWYNLYDFLYKDTGRAFWESVEEITEDGVDLVAFLPEDTWAYNSMDKKTGSIPAYLRNNHNLDAGGYEQMTGHVKRNHNDDEDDELDLDSVRRASAKEEDDDDEDDLVVDDLEKETPKGSNGTTNYYYYNYNNSLNQTDDHSTHDHSTHDNSTHDDHSYHSVNKRILDDHSQNKTVHSQPNQKKDEEYWHQVEASMPWELDDPNHIEAFTESIFDGKNKATCKLKKLPSRFRDDVEYANEKLIKNMFWIIENDDKFRLPRSQEDTVTYFLRQMKKRRFFSVVGNTRVKRNNERHYSGETLVIPEVDPVYYTPSVKNDLISDFEGNVSMQRTIETERNDLSPDIIELINEIMEKAFERFKEKHNPDDEFKSLELVGRGGRTGFHWVVYKLKPAYAKRMFDYIKNPRQYPLTEATVKVQKPESDHPVRDALLDVDQALVKQHQRNKKAVQNAQNVGKALVKPVQRTKGWIGNMISDFQSNRDTKQKEAIADPAATKSLAHRAVQLLKVGAVAQAGLLFNPVFVGLKAIDMVDKHGRKDKLRNEIISEIKTAIEILDDQIKLADRDENYKAKYEMIRQRNSLNNKLIRVSAGKNGYKLV